MARFQCVFVFWNSNVICGEETYTVRLFVSNFLKISQVLFLLILVQLSTVRMTWFQKCFLAGESEASTMSFLNPDVSS